MNHDRVRQLLPAHLEYELGGRKRSAVDRHLEACEDCRRELYELRRTVYLLRQLDAEQPPDGLADRVLAAVAEAGAPGLVERLRIGIGRFLEGPFGAPLLTAGVGAIAVLAVSGLGIEVELKGWGEVDAPLGEAVALAAERAPTAPASQGSDATVVGSRRFEGTAPVATRSAQQRAMASGVPLPAACLEQPHHPACLPWHSFLVGLAMHDTPAFLAEVDAIPGSSRERWLGELSRFAGPSSSALVAAQLRAAPDPRAARVASSFERIAAGPRR
jgi:anti-sigma factor RsiW